MHKASISGAARVPSARESKIYFCGPSNKTAKFKVKNIHESVEKTKPKHLPSVTFVIFRSNKVRLILETHVSKATTRRKLTLRRFYSFFSKNTHF